MTNDRIIIGCEYASDRDDRAPSVPQRVQSLAEGGFLVSLHGDVEEQAIHYDADFCPTSVPSPAPFTPLCSGVHRTPQGTFLALDLPGERVLEWDRQGRVVWSLARPRPCYALRLESGLTLVAERGDHVVRFFDREGRLRSSRRALPGGLIASVQPLPRGGLLIADRELHVVYELSARDEVIWTHGEPYDPGRGADRLAEPRCAKRLESGTTLIADTMNNRVLEVESGGAIVWCHGSRMRSSYEDTRLLGPVWADRSMNGQTVIADAGNQRVVAVDLDGRETWTSRPRDVTGRLFSYPRSVQALPGGHLLVADTSHDRVLELDAHGEVVWRYEGPSERPLRWPRSAERQPDGSTLIADGRGNRVLLVGPDDEVSWECSHYRFRGRRHELADPHHATRLPSGTILVTESAGHCVVELDVAREVVWRYGSGEEGAAAGRLRDPHFASRISAETLIADSGNRRLVLVNRAGEPLWARTAYWHEGQRFALGRVRWCARYGDSEFLFLDSTHATLGVMDWSGVSRARFAPRHGVERSALRSARWAAALGDGRIVIPDTEGHRLVVIQPDLERPSPRHSFDLPTEAWDG